MVLSVILVEADVTSPAGVVSTLRFSDRAIPPMSPADPTHANFAWDERILEPPTLRRSLFDDLQALEPGLAVGGMILSNADRALDPYQAYVWGEVRVWRWRLGEPFSAAISLLTGPASGTPAYDVTTARAGRVTLTLFDARRDLERPAQDAAYGGGNSVDDEVYFDGDQSLRGRLKPLAFGDLTTAHVPGVMVDYGNGAWQLHDGPIWRDAAGFLQAEVQIFDRGDDAGVATGGDVSTVVDTPEEFYTFALTADHPELPLPTPGSLTRYYTWADGGLLRTNANLAGTIAFGLKGSSETGGYVDTAGPIIARLLKRLGVADERIGGTFATVDAPQVLGVYAAEPITARELVGWIARAGPLAILPDRQGVWQAVAIAPPAETADFTLTADDVLDLTADEAAPTGAGEFQVGWDRVWTTYRRETLLPALHYTAAEARLAETYRYVTLTDEGFQARYPQSWRPLKLDTALRVKADAEALADRLKALFGLRADGKPRRQWRVQIEMTDAVLEVPLGATVALGAPQWGVDDRFLLIGEEPMRPRRNLMTWTLWG